MGQEGGEKIYKLCVIGYCLAGEAAVSEEVRHQVMDELVKEISLAITDVKRLYRTHHGRTGTVDGVFVEFAETSRSRVVQFLTAVNCLSAIYNASFADELARYVEVVKSKHVKILLDCVNDNKMAERPVIVYCRDVIHGGIELPMDMLSFKTRISDYLDSNSLRT